MEARGRRPGAAVGRPALRGVRRVGQGGVPPVRALVRRRRGGPREEERPVRVRGVRRHAPDAVPVLRRVRDRPPRARKDRHVRARRTDRPDFLQMTTRRPSVRLSSTGLSRIMDEGARLCAAGDLLAQRNHGAELLLFWMEK